MKVSFRLLIGTSCVLTCLMSAATSAKAWNYTSTGQWASVTYGSATIYQDEWGSSNSCTLYANSASNWATSGSWSGWGVKDYCHVQYEVNNIDTRTSTITGSWNWSRPSGSSEDDSFDCWDSNGNEYMIWEYYCGNVAPLGSQVASNVTIGDGTYNVYYGNNGSNNCVSFLRTNMQSSSGTENYVAQIMAYAYNHGWSNSPYCKEISFGFEISEGSGQWTMNSCSINWGQNSSYSSGISNGNHAVVPQCATNARLDANGWSGSNGAKVQIWNGSYQTWTFTNNGSGIYQIAESWNTGACLDVSGGGSSGTLTQIWSCWGGSPQQWGAISDGGSIYEFEPQCALGTRLDVWGASSSNGTQVGIWTANGASNQKWAVN